MDLQLQQKLALLDQCNQYQHRPFLEADMKSFLKRNHAVSASVRKLIKTTDTGKEEYKAILLRGKLPINTLNKVHKIGFKFYLVERYPMAAPYV